MREIGLFDALGDFGEDKDSAAAVRETVIKPCIAAREPVIIDFSGVTLVTQSFIHALISDVLRTTGESALDYIEFKSCNNNVQGIIETVVQYSLDTIE